jgi:hypothetical protein
METYWHISDEELLLEADGELRDRRSAQVRGHLKACWRCRARMARMESAVVDFVEASQSEGPELPPMAGPRALLRAQLATTPAAGSQSPWWCRLRVHSPMAYALAALALVIALAFGAILHEQTANRISLGSREGPGGVLPNPAFTPGATRPISLAEACSSVQSEVVTPVTRQEQSEVFAEYGLTKASAQNYEVDFLITPDLGGADDIRNMWPEPHRGAVWSSYAKDKLEDRLHQLVCGGKLSLSAAQQEISNNWIVAYQKYLQAEAPASVDVPIGSILSAFSPFRQALKEQP